MKSTYQLCRVCWCFSDRASWIDYILITNWMHWLLFIQKILFSSTCFEPQVLIFRRIKMYTCSIWYCHSLREVVVACRYTDWVRTDCRGKVVGGCLQTPTNNLHGENILFDASLVIYTNSTNIPSIMVINRIYKHQNLVSLLVYFLVGLRTFQHPCKQELHQNRLYRNGPLAEQSTK